MARCFITKQAVDDLSSIWKYTFETWSEKQADTYYSELVNTVRRIASYPKNLDREYIEIHPGLYCRRCNKHIVFYRITETGDVEIVRILHDRMDIKSKLK